MLAKQQPGAYAQATDRVRMRVAPASVMIVSALVSLSVLSGCNPLRGTAPVDQGLLPTRTLAPLRTVAPVTAAPSATARPAATEVPSSSPSSPTATAEAVTTPVATHVPAIVACTDTKLDLGAPSPAPVPAAAPGRIAFVSLDGNVAMTDVAGKIVQQITTDANTSDDKHLLRIYTYQTFSTDGKSLAFVGYTTISGTGTVTQTLFVAPAEPKPKLSTLFSTTDDNIPYLDWSPDNKFIAFLTINPQRGAMQIVSKDGGKPTVIEQGSSAYWQWRNDSTAVVAHMSGSPATNADAHISIVDAKSSQPKRIDSVPGNFKAPSYSPNSQYILFVARSSDNNDDLVLADGTGKPICAVAAVETGASFAWSPDGHRVAWIDSAASTNNPAALYVLDLTAGVRTKVHDSAVSFFWSPDSMRLAVFSIVDNGTPTRFGQTSAPTATPDPQSATPVLRIEISNVATAGTVQVADTIPTRGVIQLLGFFDQYSRALTPWSPDGKQLVFTSASDTDPTVDVVVATLNSSGDNVDLKRITAGVIAFWSPR
jgi:Tol biopolymer transport system component